MAQDPYLPPGCTQAEIDALLEDEWPENDDDFCAECGARIDGSEPDAGLCRPCALNDPRTIAARQERDYWAEMAHDARRDER